MIFNLIVLIVSIIIICIAAAIGFKNGVDWQRDRAESWGNSHMEELGVKDKENR